MASTSATTSVPTSVTQAQVQAQAQAPASNTQARTPNVPPLLLCEALGFSPQLLLDDIINIANNAVQDGVNGMEEFLVKWAEERSASHPTSSHPNHNQTGIAQSPDATTHEVEQGLVAFQTLLEYHTDIAFDFFEAWCLRNIFMIPPDLPVVLPHQKGLDLTLGDGGVEDAQKTEAELVGEVEGLRARLDAHRKLKRVLQRAVRTSARQRQHAEARLASLSSLSLSSLPPSSNSQQHASHAQHDGNDDPLHALPAKIHSMYTTLAALPPLDVPARAPGAQPEPGKRPWETSKTGYLNWAVGRLVERAEAGSATGTGTAMDADGGLGGGAGGAGKAAVDAAEAGTKDVGSSVELKRAFAAVHAVGAVRRDLEGVAGGARRESAATAGERRQSFKSGERRQSLVAAGAGSSQQSSQQLSQQSNQQSSQPSHSQPSHSQYSSQPLLSQTTTQPARPAHGRRQSLIPSQNRRREADGAGMGTGVGAGSKLPEGAGREADVDMDVEAAEVDGEDVQMEE